MSLGSQLRGLEETLPLRPGIIGGKFMERGRIAKARSEEGAPTEYYQPEDLFVGAHVEFNSHKFVLIDADEYALRYMETHPQQVSCLLWLA